MKDYEHYFRIAWTGPKYCPYMIQFQRYTTLQEANQALANWLEDPPGGTKSWGVIEHLANPVHTVGELKKALAELPDDQPVYMQGSEWEMEWDGTVSTYSGSKCYPPGIILES